VLLIENESAAMDLQWQKPNDISEHSNAKLLRLDGASAAMDCSSNGKQTWRFKTHTQKKVNFIVNRFQC